jgi:phytoene dehydrogenase-like protein
VGRPARDDRRRGLTPGRPRHDAVVVGSGPNGLAAAVTLAEAGRSVLVLEGEDEIGGGCRSAALTLPGFTHDLCSAVHPLLAASPFFRSLPLGELGIELLHPPAPLAHPLDGGRAVMLERSVEATAAGLGADGRAWRRLMAPLARPPRAPAALPAAAGSAARLAGRFRGEEARALVAGTAAHSLRPLEAALTGGVGLALAALGHAVGWPVVRGGSGRIAEGLARRLRALGGEVETGRLVRGPGDLPPARVTLLDVAPPALLRIAGRRMVARRRRGLERYRFGPGVFKVDWALSGPIPWAAGGARRAGTLHLGGTFAEIAAAERAAAAGRLHERPFVLLVQPSVADATRAPAGAGTAWAYCHVPSRSPADMTGAIEAQVERFAPGFGDLVLARASRGPAVLEAGNPNLVGGDITGGVMDVRQVVARPALRALPWATPVPGLYLCSSSTPPGPGVHGMCGHLAARAALLRELR